MARSTHRIRNQSGSAKSAEFATALTVLFLLILFPLINLIGFAMGAGTQYLLTTQCVARAGASATFGEALTAMENTATSMTNSGLGHFANMQPVAGSSGTGTNLFVIRTPLGGSSTTYGPNTPYAGILDEENNVYEYQVRSTFDIGPFMSMSAVPWVSDIPGLGRPARLNFVASQVVEYSDGLAMGGSGSSGTTASGSTGGSGPIGSLPSTTRRSGAPSGTGGDITMPNGWTYTPDELKWWDNHRDDKDPWGGKPNPYL
ncbi:hypothetical protein GC174_03570 [bacterium]|nr:hypothetical protein [bacterium]